MRIQEIKHILQRNLPKLDILEEATGGLVYLKNVNDFQKAIFELDELKLFNQTISKIKSSGIFRTFDDAFHISPDTWKEIVKPIENLKNVIEAFIEALNNLTPSFDENTISIKLPIVKNFNELEKISSDINKAISIPISEKEIGGQVKIQGVDSGSIWFYVLLGTPAAVALIAGLAWAATVVYKKLQEGRAFNEYVKNLKLKNEQTEVFVKAQKEQVSLLVTEQAKMVQDKHFKKKDAEQLERLKLSINTMSELIDKGFEIHPSLVAPEKVANLFPDFKSIHFPSFETKQISAGDKQENKS